MNHSTFLYIDVIVNRRFRFCLTWKYNRDVNINFKWVYRTSRFENYTLGRNCWDTPTKIVNLLLNNPEITFSNCNLPCMPQAQYWIGGLKRTSIRFYREVIIRIYHQLACPPMKNKFGNPFVCVEILVGRFDRPRSNRFELPRFLSAGLFLLN